MSPGHSAISPPAIAHSHVSGQELARYEVAGYGLTLCRFPAGAIVPRHAHSRAQLCFLLNGGYAESSGGRSTDCRGPLLALHPPGEVHSNRISAAGALDLIVDVTPERLNQLREAVPVFTRPAYVREGRPLACARRLYRQLRRTDAATPLAVEGLVLEVLAEAHRSTTAVPPGMSPPAWLVRVRDWLHDSASNRLTVSGLAAEAGVHPAHLCRVFRRHFGTSPGEYVRRLRLQEAREALAATSRPIAEIAQAAGFCDQAHLGRAFREHFGTSPARFRQSSRPR